MLSLGAKTSRGIGRGNGRLTKWEQSVLPRLDEVEAWARDGVSDKDIAHNLGIALSTLYDYKSQHEELSRAMARGKTYVDDVIVTNAYLRRIVGYDAQEVKREYKIQEDGTRLLIKETTQTRHIPGDPRAAEFWLCSRQPKKWSKTINQAISAAQDAQVVELPAALPKPERPPEGAVVVDG